MLPQVLIVEDSEFYGKLLKRSISSQLGHEIIWFRTYAEAEASIEQIKNVNIALLDYHLPDAMNGEIIDLCAKHSIPSVVMTGAFSSDLQEFIWSKRVIDYVLKEGSQSIGYLVDLVDRINKNKKIGILIVDDSRMGRSHLKKILKIHKYKLYEAQDGKEGLKVLKDNSDIKLVLTDYHMPVCDGFEFTKRIRNDYPVNRLAIIGISASGNHVMMTKFLKYGANDFLTKPFISELLYSRINQNIKIIEMFETIREVSLIDPLTKVHNRRYLNEAGEILFNTALRNKTYMAVAMIDLDNFKIVNDTMGHATGDLVLKQLAAILKENVRKSDILSRYGGEEFCIICGDLDPKQAILLFDKLRKLVNDHIFSFEGNTFQVTASIGVCLDKKNTLSEMINSADGKMYEAKQQGKNRVCI